MSSLAANLRRVATDCGDRRRFAGFWRFVAVKKTSRSKGLNATGSSGDQYAADSIAA
jgi:hypothetical protein